MAQGPWPRCDRREPCLFCQDAYLQKGNEENLKRFPTWLLRGVWSPFTTKKKPTIQVPPSLPASPSFPLGTPRLCDHPSAPFRPSWVSVLSWGPSPTQISPQTFCPPSPGLLPSPAATLLAHKVFAFWHGKLPIPRAEAWATKNAFLPSKWELEIATFLLITWQWFNQNLKFPLSFRDNTLMPSFLAFCFWNPAPLVHHSKPCRSEAQLNKVFLKHVTEVLF